MTGEELILKIKKQLMIKGKYNTINTIVTNSIKYIISHFRIDPSELLLFMTDRMRPDVYLRKSKFKNNLFYYPKLLKPEAQFYKASKMLCNYINSNKKQFIYFEHAITYSIINCFLTLNRKDNFFYSYLNEINSLSDKYYFNVMKKPAKKKSKVNRKFLFNIYKTFKIQK